MTLFILGSTAALLILYDIFIVLHEGHEETISWQGWLVAKKYPVIPFALGIVLGHIFWPNCG